MATTPRTPPRSTEARPPRGGAALGAAGPPSVRAHAHVAHHVPGRLRLKVIQAGGDDEADFFDEVRERFARLPGVHAVRVSRSSRSIVLSYDPADADFAGRLQRESRHTDWLHLGALAELAGSLDEAIGVGLESAARHSRLAEALVSGAEEVDHQMRRVSDGYLDLKMLLPLGVAAASTLRKARHQGTPMWMTLATFAFNTFISLHRNRIDGPTVRPGSRTAHPPGSARR